MARPLKKQPKEGEKKSMKQLTKGHEDFMKEGNNELKYEQKKDALERFNDFLEKAAKTKDQE